MKNYNSKRHLEIIKKLKDANKGTTETTERNTKIAKKLGVGITTVYNYTNGRIKDGYLAEDILNLMQN